jgi:aspartyl/asparaginyl beta-hydroxylase (cupin superfamily)
MHAFAELVRRWNNGLFYRFLGGDRRPVFFDAEATFPALRAIDENYEAIRAELLALLPRRTEIPLYHEVDQAQQGISGQDKRSWRVFFVKLHNAGDELPNVELVRKTRAVIDGIPDVLQAFFSILEPRKSVPAHNGPYLGYLRYHTAFVVPRENPPTLRVKDRLHTWREGQSLLFDDSWNHEVYNQSEGERVVLIVDVLRPMPWPLALLNRLARRVFFSKRLLRPALAKIKPIHEGGAAAPVIA